MDDMISRSALRTSLEMRKMIEIYPEWRTLSLGMREKIGRLAGAFRNAIDSAPVIEAMPLVHARWIYSGYVDADGNRHANCSRCGAGEEHKEEWTDKVPYCWNCGARMDKKEEHE